MMESVEAQQMLLEVEVMLLKMKKLVVAEPQKWLLVAVVIPRLLAELLLLLAVL